MILDVFYGTSTKTLLAAVERARGMMDVIIKGKRATLHSFSLTSSLRHDIHEAIILAAYTLPEVEHAE